MTLRTILAVALALGVVIGWSFLFPPPPPPEPGEAPALAEEGALDPSGAGGEVPGSESLAREEGVPEEPGLGEELETAIVGQSGQSPISIVTETQEITLSPRGGRVIAWRLLDYPSDPADPSAGPVDLVSPESRALDRHPLVIDPGDPELFERVNDAWYVAEREGLVDERELARRGLPSGTERVRFRWADGRGLAVEKTLYVPPRGYLVELEWSLTLNGNPLPGAVITWGPGLGPPQVSSSTYTRFAEAGLVGLPGDMKRVDEGDLDGSTYQSFSQALRWIGLDTRYFTAAMVASEPNASGAVRVLDLGGYAPPSGDSPVRRIAVETAARELTIFAGPKKLARLDEVDQSLGTSLQESIKWGFFGFLARPLYHGLDWLHTALGNWGLAILAMTTIIKLLFVPLTHRSMVSMKKTQAQMAKLQPKVKKLKDKYRDKRDMESRQQMQKEMMELYSRHGVNPMSTLTGCLPLFLQMPVLLGMLSVLTVAVELRGAPFYAWIGDLSAPDPLYITPILMGATMFLQQMMAMAKTEDPQQRTQQRIMMFMPVMFTYFFLWAPSGLVLYWLANSVLGIVQQVFINRHADQAQVAKAPART